MCVACVCGVYVCVRACVCGWVGVYGVRVVCVCVRGCMRVYSKGEHTTTYKINTNVKKKLYHNRSPSQPMQFNYQLSLCLSQV